MINYAWLFQMKMAETIEDLFNDHLWNAISIRDTAVKGRKENFYCGVLLGLSKSYGELGCLVEYIESVKVIVIFYRKFRRIVPEW